MIIVRGGDDVVDIVGGLIDEELVLRILLKSSHRDLVHEMQKVGPHRGYTTEDTGARLQLGNPALTS